MKTPASSRHQDQTDAAALGGGVVAVAMTMFAEPGKYDWLGAIVALALLLLIFGYLNSHFRNWPKSIALAAVTGLICLPILGVPAEKSRGFWTAESPHRPWSEFLQFVGIMEEDSTVSEGATIGAWILITAVVTLGDQWWWQKRLKRKAEEERAAEDRDDSRKAGRADTPGAP